MLQEEAAALGKSSFAFAFYMDRQKEERERGVTISCTTKEFFTEKWHYTIIDAPGEYIMEPMCLWQQGAFLQLIGVGTGSHLPCAASHLRVHVQKHVCKKHSTAGTQHQQHSTALTLASMYGRRHDVQATGISSRT